MSPPEKLCSYCYCTDYYVVCERLSNPRLLLSYDGPKVISLIISNSSLMDLKKEHLSKFSNVTSLTLESDNFRIGMSELSLMRSVINLNLEDNAITEIKTRMFVENVEVENLYLGRNKIAHIANGAFFGLSKLSKLKLERNLLRRLESKSFDGLSELKELDLSFNELEALDSTVLEPVKSLELLLLRSNKVWSLTSDVVGLLSARSLLHVDVANTRAVCACGAPFDAWRAALRVGLLHTSRGLQDLLCSSGESWISAMDRFVCPSTANAIVTAASWDTSPLHTVSDAASGAPSPTVNTTMHVSKQTTSHADVTSRADDTRQAYERGSHPRSDAFATGAPSEFGSHSFANPRAPRNSGEQIRKHNALQDYTRHETNEYFVDSEDKESNNDFKADFYYDTHERKLIPKRRKEEIGDEDLMKSYETSHSNVLYSNRTLEIVMVLIVSVVAITATVIGANNYMKLTKIRENRKRSPMNESLLQNSEDKSLEQIVI